jgi:TolB-like protein
LLFSFENFTLDTNRRELRGAAGPIAVEPQVFDLLTYLICNRDRVVSKDDLIAAVWHGRIVSESALTTRINAVRSALNDSGEAQRLVKTLPRKGIRFVGEVRQQADATKSGASAAERASAMLALPNRPSIAVLPFANLSDDPKQEYFAEGMAEEIITALSRCNWLFVIAKNSTFIYKGKNVDVRDVSRELGVRYVLQGSVRRAGDRLRILGQVVDATSGANIWADRFDGELSDVFDLQDRLTESIVAAIEPKLQSAEIERLKHKAAANFDAYDLLLRAQQLEAEFTAESLGAAIQCAERALEIDPRYAPAMALAANCYRERRYQGWSSDPNADAATALRLATRAVELAGDDGNVLWMAAFCNLAADTHRARELANRSLLINPNSAIALTIAGWVEAFLANPTKGLELLEHALRLSPRDPRGWFMATGMSWAHFAAGQFDDAADWARRALAVNPRIAIALRILASSLALLGKRENAAEIIRDVLTLEPGLTAARLRERLKFMDSGLWNTFAQGLRLAGLPD